MHPYLFIPDNTSGSTSGKYGSVRRLLTVVCLTVGSVRSVNELSLTQVVETCRDITSAHQDRVQPLDGPSHRLEGLMACMAQHKLRLDAQRSLVLKEKLSMRSRLGSRLELCLEAAKAPLEAHGSALLDLLAAATRLHDQYRAGPEGDHEGQVQDLVSLFEIMSTAKKPNRPFQSMQVQRWEAWSRTPMGQVHMPELAEAVGLAGQEQLQRLREEVQVRCHCPMACSLAHWAGFR